MSLRHAAWVPDEDDRSWDEAADLAIAWIDERCAEEGDPDPVLLTQITGQQGGPLDAFARRAIHLSQRNASNNWPSGTGPVLVYVPTPEMLDIAQRLARGSALVAVEGVHSMALAGWAREVGAVNLLDGSTSEPLDNRVATAVERLVFYGNNGFTRGFGADRAREILQSLQSQGLLDRDVIVAAVAASPRVSGAGAKRLGELIDKIQGR